VIWKIPLQISIKKFSALLLCFLGGVATTAVAQDKQTEGMAIIQRAIELTDLTQSGPYQMHNILTLTDETLGKQFTGEEAVFFVSPEKWRRELRIKGYYDESAIFKGNMMYRGRSLNFTPPGARKDVAGSLRNLPDVVKYKVLRVYDRKVNDLDTRCVYLQNGGQRNYEITWCIDPKTGLPAAQYYRESGHYIEFREYKAFGKKFVPNVVEVFSGGKSKEKAVISISQGVPDDPKTFEAPSTYPARPWCDNMQALIVVDNKRPDIPQLARRHTGWELLYEMTVDEKGNVVNVVPMSPKPFADRIVMDTLAGWKFKPAMCGANPVPTDFIVSMQ
jgi:hypothetical protein